MNSEELTRSLIATEFDGLLAITRIDELCERKEREIVIIKKWSRRGEK